MAGRHQAGSGGETGPRVEAGGQRGQAGAAALPPLIGITAMMEPARWGAWIREAALLPARYVRAVRNAGGCPVMLPPAGPAEVRAAVARLDGIVFAGGGDLEPRTYHEEPHEATEPPQPDRDRFELALMRGSIQTNLPFLAIGRGMHVLNVAREGKLIQHLPEAAGVDAAAHDAKSGGYGPHPVQIGLGSLVGKALGDHADVASGHHQGVRRLGRGLVAVAWSADQLVEAVELQGHPFGVGVQWHPEEGSDLGLFEALVAAAKERATRA